MYVVYLKSFYFLIYAFIAINIPLRIAFAAFYRFWCAILSCYSVSRHFLNFFLISSLTHWLFRNLLFSFHSLVNFPAFLLLISSFIPLWLEKIHGMISIFLNFLRLVLWPSYDLSLGMFHGALAKNVRAAAVRCKVQSHSLSQGSQFLYKQPPGDFLTSEPRQP